MDQAEVGLVVERTLFLHHRQKGGPGAGLGDPVCVVGRGLGEAPRTGAAKQVLLVPAV